MLTKIFAVAIVLVEMLNFKCINAVSVPFITLCKSNDAECARENAVRAIPLFASGLSDYGVESMDPVTFKTVNSSSANLKFILNDVALSGLRNCKPNKVQRDIAKSNIFLQLSCALNVDGQYELAGQVLLLNIRGKGKMHVLLRNLVINIELDIIQKDGEDGEKHFNIQKHKLSYDLKDISDVVFEGLFENNAVLSKATDELIKNNGNDIVREIGGPMFQATVVKIVKNLNNFFEIVPIKDLSLE